MTNHQSIKQEMPFPMPTDLKESLKAVWHFNCRSITEAFRGQIRLRSVQPDSILHDQHLSAAVDWLKRSIKVCGGRASSKGYRFPNGWMPPYPETTGYIIPTLMNLGDVTGDPEWYETAVRLGDWLTTIQRTDGGFTSYHLGASDDADVFDTGMILLGWNALQHHQRSPKITEAASRAAAFLREAIGKDGAYERHISHRMLHTYNVRSSWALIAYGMLENDQISISAGIKNVDWTLKQQASNGFFANNGFKPSGHANTHGIAYVLRGLLQVYLLTQRQDLIDAVFLAAGSVRDKFNAEGWLAAEIGPNWDFKSRHVCLTGCVQIAIVFFRLSELKNDPTFINPAERLIAQVATTQAITGRKKASYGGVAGSYPIYGGYAPLQYPNWATKFLIDALLVRKQWHDTKQTLRERDLWSG